MKVYIVSAFRPETQRRENLAVYGSERKAKDAAVEDARSHGEMIAECPRWGFLGDLYDSEGLSIGWQVETFEVGRRNGDQGR